MAEDKKFPVNAIHVIRTAQTINVQLSAMADQKASILMGATFVIFTITISQSHGHTPPLPLLILGAAAFAAAVCAVLAIVPAFGLGRRKGPANLLFFGSFASLEEEDYLAQMLAILGDEEEGYRAMARDMHQNGRVLARKKYRMLGYAYRIFLLGMTASLIAFVAERFV
ncbi:MAG TPA: Pycsar system effector family protein [Allosphingosinicella sp.]|jgi:hypothetical protein|nr:Pycsar system effector family protein [Allosphingosinicella sp.]